MTGISALQKLKKAVADGSNEDIISLLQEAPNAVNENTIEAAVRNNIEILDRDHVLPEQTVKEIIDDILMRTPLTMSYESDDCMLTDQETDQEHWLTGNLGKWLNCWNYWAAYRKKLENKMSREDLEKTKQSTMRILQAAGNPQSAGSWHRKGMVVGEVQAGKTSNYIGVMCRAADVGYRVFIVLAGITDYLRKQTQDRIQEDFIGDKYTRPIFLTGKRDFSKQSADSVAMTLSADDKNPLVLVLKKHKKVLENLCSWIKENNEHNPLFKDVALMLIDDEADNASVNTNTSTQDASAINRNIRKLLNLFSRAAYLGYTATPFANIFIDFDKDPYKDDSLFPRNFIYYLPPSKQYAGATEFFINGKSQFIREIDDCGESSSNGDAKDLLLYIKHPKKFRVTALPESLKNAVCMFVQVCSIRLLRDQTNEHNSMLINVSRFNDVQKQIAKHTSDYLQEIKEDIEVNVGLKTPDPDSVLIRMEKLYDQEYRDAAGLSWEQIKSKLLDAITKIQVELVNQKNSSKNVLDYKAYKDGLSVIAVGGLSLSRGLTLEGLSISYVVRNTLMYDALLQMGRWFGYRNGYKELCRVFLMPKAVKWYTFVTEAVNELYDDFAFMEQKEATPVEFGLKVRKNPNNLLITAQSKMRNAVSVTLRANLWGRTIETYNVYPDGHKQEENLQLVKDFTADLIKKYGKPSPSIGRSGLVWRNAEISEIKQFVHKFRNTPNAVSVQPQAVESFLQKMQDEYNYTAASVAVISPQTGRDSRTRVELTEDITVFTALRSFSLEDDHTATVGKNRHIISGSNSKGDVSADAVIDFTQEELDSLKEKINSSHSPDSATSIMYSCRKQPLLLILLLNLTENTNGQKMQTIYSQVPAYALVFPKPDNINTDEADVVYTLNKVCYSMYSEPEEDEAHGSSNE